MKNILILSISFLFIISSCSKDNQTAKQLEGSWNITSLKLNSIETITANSSADITFIERNKNSGRYITKVYFFNNLADEVNGTFEVEDKGSKITLNEDGANDPGTGTIEEISSSSLKVTYINDNDDTVIFRAEKK